MNQALKHYFLLLKIQFKAMFSMKEVKGENMRKTVGYALLMGFVFIYLAVMVFIFFSAIYSSGLPQQIAAGVTASMLAAFVVASTVINLRSVFGLYGASRDLPFLLSLPIKPGTLFASKFTGAYFIALGVHAIFLVPMFIPLFINFGSAAGWALGFAFLLISPCIPLVIASAVSLVIVRITRGKRRSDMLMSVIGLLFFAAFFFGIQLLNSRISQSITQGGIGALFTGDVVSKMSQMFPPAGWVADALIYPAQYFGGFIAYAALSIFLVAVLVYFGAKHYASGAAMLSSAPVSRKKFSIKSETGSAFGAIVLKETRVVLRSPTYALNSLTGLIMGPFFALLPLFSSAYGEIREAIPSEGNIPFLVALGMMAFIAAIDPAASSCISREGKAAWIMQVIPVPVMAQTLAKLAFPFIYCALSLILFSALMPIGWPITYAQSALAAIIVLIASVPMLFFSVLPDMRSPRLRWSSEQECMKRGMNNLVAMLYSLLATLPHVLIFALLHDNIMIAIAVSVAFSISATIFCYSWLKKLAGNLLGAIEKA